MISWNSLPVLDVPGHPNDIRLYDTSQGAVLALPEEPVASMYVCGITPYDATHMGHAATYVAFDLLNRLWRDAGRRVQYVQNVTDVDDPLLERATERGVNWRDLAQDQTDLFRADMTALNVLAPDHFVGAVESIEWLVPEVEELVRSGAAYAVTGYGSEPDGDIYFSVEAAGAEPDNTSGAWWLGQISGLSEPEMLPLFAERGGDPGRPGKRHPLDPLLWRAARPGEPQWDGRSLGPGRPGWHIECTVIAQRFLPAPFTVQGGGSDLIFPHHEMGAGHAYALSGQPMARYFVHTGMVGLDGEKMSKSKGNLVLVSAVRAAGTDPAAIRLAILAHHYRSDWFWTDDLLEQAHQRLDSWRRAMDRTTPAAAADLANELRAALADDLDAPLALTAADRWAENTLNDADTPAGGEIAGSSSEASSGSDAELPAGPELARRVIESLLGVRL